VGITPALDQVEIGVSRCPAAGRHRLTPMPLVKSAEAVEAWWDLSPRFQSPGDGWAQVLEPISAKLPIYLRNGNNYWSDYLPDSGILYFQYNRSENMPTDKVSIRGKAARGARQAEAEGLCPGSTVQHRRQFRSRRAPMKELVTRTEGIPRFVITGRATFSAGISAATTWRVPGILFVGEPVGDELDMWSEGGNIRLPNSGYDAHFANGLHSYSPAPCPAGVGCRDLSVETLDPHLPATAAFAEYRAGRDPPMEAILARLGTRR
jgi:hypothetical protein